MGIGERLSAMNDEIKRLRTEIGVLEEQLAFVHEVAEDARLRAVVSETPLADREYQDARADAERTRRSLEDAKGALARIRSEQDRLLERMLEEPS